MTARIVIQSGISAGASHRIEKSVVRIGSDNASDVVIPSAILDAHALTIESRQNGYRVYNRGNEPVFVGAQVVQPNGHATWIDTDLIELPDGVTLALELGPEPTSPIPSPLAATPLAATPVTATPRTENGKSSNDSLDHPSERDILQTHEQRLPALPPSASTPSRSELTKPITAGPSKTVVQLGVIGLCILGGALLLARDQMRSELAAEPQAPQFDSVIRAAMEDDSPFSNTIVERLQVAESALIRNQTAIARLRYRQLHDALTQARSIGQRMNTNTQLDNSAGVMPQSSVSTSTSPYASDDILAQVQLLTEHRLRQLGH